MILLFLSAYFSSRTAPWCFTRYVIRVVTTVRSHDGATRGISFEAVMDGAKLNSRSTINQDHRLVGVGTRLTLLPLPRCTDGYLTHRLKWENRSYMYSLPDIFYLQAKRTKGNVLTNYQFHQSSS